MSGRASADLCLTLDKSPQWSMHLRREFEQGEVNLESSRVEVLLDGRVPGLARSPEK